MKLVQHLNNIFKLWNTPSVVILPLISLFLVILSITIISSVPVQR